MNNIVKIDKKIVEADKKINEICVFSEQANVYIQTHKTIPYCKQCPKPYLCMVCLSGIGEALLIEKADKKK